MTAGPIVVATDGSEESLRAVEWAAREAELRGLPLRIVSAAALPPRMAEHETASGVATVADTVVSDRDRGLAAATQRATATAPDILIDADGLSGSPARAITEAGSGASMLVVGSRGMGAFTALVLGSVSRYAATHAPCPVVVVRDETTAAHRQVAVGVGDPETSGAALSFAFEAAALRHASVLAVHAWNTPRSETVRAFEDLGAPGGRRIQEQLASKLTALVDDWRGKYPDVPVSQ